MRTVTFSDANVRKLLHDDFVCCYTNTTGDPTAGASFQHAPADEPGPCGRGAGRQNVQSIFLTPQGEIFHVATGYLSSEDMVDELKFSRQLFANLQRHPQHRQETVVAAHETCLKQLGFNASEIRAADDPLSDVFLSGPNPQDFGINMPKPADLGLDIAGPGGKLFQDVARQRMRNDHQFVIRHPLLARDKFQQQPELLVGRHKSFFGSHSAMNGIGQMFNDKTRQLRVAVPNMTR